MPTANSEILKWFLVILDKRIIKDATVNRLEYLLEKLRKIISVKLRKSFEIQIECDVTVAV